MKWKSKYGHSMILASLIVVIMTVAGCNSQPGKAKLPVITNGQDQTGKMFNGKDLEGWSITNFGPQGPVYVSEGVIVLGMGDGCTGITWNGDFPSVNYEISLEVRKVKGNDFFCGLTFPVDSSWCSLIVGGWSGSVVGLSSIDGLDASENETRTLRKFGHGEWYVVRLQVTDTNISAWIGEDQVIDFDYGGRKLSIRPEVSLSRPLGICSWYTTAELRDISFREL